LVALRGYGLDHGLAGCHSFRFIQALCAGLRPSSVVFTPFLICAVDPLLP
jgi:hypothetical protein